MKVPFLSFSQTNKQIKNESQIVFEKFFDDASYILGERLGQFEQQFAAFSQVSHCVGVSNGLDALHLALRSLDVGPGDEVIVPSNTFIATVLAVSYVGANPIFIEPNISTYNIDPARIRAALTPRTKVIIPVHLYGQACEMFKIQDIAIENKVHIVEDNAQAQGASHGGKLTGSFGDVNATSFYPGKNLGAFGDAGALTTNNEKIAQKVRALRNYGSTKKYHNEYIGYNMRMDELQAALLSIKLKYLADWTHNRQRIASWYSELLAGVGDLILPFVHSTSTHVFHLYVVRTKKRDALMDYLATKEIGTLVHYPIPPHLQKAYKSLGYKKGDFPIAEELSATSLSLPIWPGMTKEMVQYVANEIMLFFNEKA